MWLWLGMVSHSCNSSTQTDTGHWHEFKASLHWNVRFWLKKTKMHVIITYLVMQIHINHLTQDASEEVSKYMTFYNGTKGFHRKS